MPEETGITRWDVHTSSEVGRGSLGERETTDAGAESRWEQSRLPAGGESVEWTMLKRRKECMKVQGHRAEGWEGRTGVCVGLCFCNNIRSCVT